MEEAAAKAREEFGRIDYVIANAGFGVIGKMEKLSLEDYRHQFETNVFGVLRTIKATQGDLIASSGASPSSGASTAISHSPGSPPIP